MRRFFRFSVRDLLWLTLVVALGLGWFVHQRQLRAELDRVIDHVTRTSDQATKWRMATGGLEDAITRIGWKVEWNVSASCVHLSHHPTSGNLGIKVYGDFCEPSALIDQRQSSRPTPLVSIRAEAKRAATQATAWYDFVRVHLTLETTPAVAAGIAGRAWALERLLREVATAA